jgi:nucleoid-associated protein YgaU
MPTKPALSLIQPCPTQCPKMAYSQDHQFLVYSWLSGVPPWSVFMLRTDLETPSSVGPSTALRFFSAALRLCLPGFLVFSCSLFVATKCRAQDVGDAAKQERARKESQQKKSKHVYTDEDLKRAQILIPEDRAELDAKKNQQAPPTAEKSPDALDAESLPPDAPLGDVARRFRKLKESRRLEQSAEFHLPFSEVPALASPKPMQPLQPHAFKPIVPPAPAAPRFAPYQPPVKRSPFARPKVFTAAPPMLAPSRPPATHLVPPQPPAPVAPAVAPPVAPAIAHAPAAKPNVIIVKPGDSLWKLAAQNLGKGLRWQELLSANPNILNPNYIVPGSQIILPSAGISLRPPAKFTVRTGDTLSQIAQTQLGHASYAACIAHANPTIRNANLIYVGQVLLLPARCTP